MRAFSQILEDVIKKESRILKHYMDVFSVKNLFAKITESFDCLI